MLSTAALAVLLVLGSDADPALRVEAPPERAYSAFSADPARRFDFWIGTWDVNLRMLQDDLTFADRIRAEASIYPILDGKAILELWDSRPIQGFSLRYHDPQADAWVLWLDWPQPNGSRLGRLTGSFRHGRGEFGASFPNADGETVDSVYAFSDVTPFSLRWDDRYSTDGGKTWKGNWVMEFTRTAVDPVWPIRRNRIPTYVDGGRCDEGRFRQQELLAGSWRGEGTRFEFFPVLDGCAVIGFLEFEDGADEFVFLTFDTTAERFVTAVLDDRPGTGLVRYENVHGGIGRYEAENEGELEWTVSHRPPGNLGDPGDRLRYERGDRVVTVERIAD